MKKFIVVVTFILSGCSAGHYTQSGHTTMTDCGRDGLCTSRSVEYQGQGSAVSRGFPVASTGYGIYGGLSHMGMPSMVPQYDSTVVVMNDGVPYMAGTPSRPTGSGSDVEQRVAQLEARSEKLRKSYQKFNRNDELFVNVMGRTLKLNQAICRAFLEDPEGAVKNEEARNQIRTACNQIPGVSE